MTCTATNTINKTVNKAKEMTRKKVTHDIKEMEEDDLGVGFTEQREITP